MSRWGNFLSGIESGLDKILQENEPENSAPRPTEQASATSNPSRNASTRVKNDKLQERLSRAVEGRRSEESARAQSNSKSTDVVRGEEPIREARVSIDKSKDTNNRGSFEKPGSGRPSLDATDTTSTLEAVPLEPVASTEPSTAQNEDTEAPDEPTVVNGSYETGDHFYVERIEALQAKLNLYIQEAADKARDELERSGTDAEAKRLAHQKEKIAALMAEGQKLSEKELKHVGIIRRLHSRTNDLEASLNRARKAEATAQREIRDWRAKAEEASAARAAAATDDEAKLTLLRQLEQVKKQNETQAKALTGLRLELDKSRANGEFKVLFENQKQQLDAEKRTIADLKEELENARIEKELGLERQKSQIEEQKSKALQEREQATIREAELQGEIKALESRIETIRTRREEETGGTGDHQAKQLRQIEALQRQYSVSKENWASMEASLNSRISTLEQERDDLTKKEVDLRRKLREATSSLRKRDEELEILQGSYQELEDKLRNRRLLEESKVDDLKAALEKSQKEVDEAREETRAVRTSLTAQIESAATSEKAEDAGLFSPHERSHSPLTSRTRSPMLRYGDTKDRKQASGLGLYQSNSVFSDRPSSSRKVAVAPPLLPSNASFRQHSFQSLTRSSSRSAIRETNSTDDEHETSDGRRTPATPGRGFNDMVSASASNPVAGPSIQLVERMSAAVRRLESEKAATSDELDRMSLERDEARKQAVSLLEEVEAKRSLDKKVAELEAQVTETSRRYQTTLELLGEKSEAVEELRADIADMKQIYRDALEKSIR